MWTINLAKDFAVSPAGRFSEDGPYNGETFRNEYLMPALRDNDEVVVVLDGVSGFGSSFLEESFGGLIRKNMFDYETLKKKLRVEYTNPKLAFYAGLINDFIRDARPE